MQSVIHAKRESALRNCAQTINIAITDFARIFNPAVIIAIDAPIDAP